MFKCIDWLFRQCSHMRLIVEYYGNKPSFKTCNRDYYYYINPTHTFYIFYVFWYFYDLGIIIIITQSTTLAWLGIPSQLHQALFKTIYKIRQYYRFISTFTTKRLMPLIWWLYYIEDVAENTITHNCIPSYTLYVSCFEI